MGKIMLYSPPAKLMTNPPTFRLEDNVSFTEVDDEVVLLELTSGNYYGLNESGAKMLLALIDGRTIEQSCSDIAHTYQIDVARVTSDMEELLEQLIERHLLVRETQA